MRYTLNKNERLKHRKLIEKLFQSGRSFSSPPYRIYFSFDKLPVKFPAQAGFGVSAKLFKKAVDRNRIKRLTREAYRLQKLDLYNALGGKEKQMTLFFVFTGRTVPEYEIVTKSVGAILQRLIKITDEVGPANS